MFARARHHVLKRPLVSPLYSSTINCPPPKPTERKVNLPKKPPVPTGPNHVYVTHKEFHKYIRPLFWYRWTVKFFSRDLYLRDGELYATAFNSPYLKRDLHFFGAENARSFLVRLSRICRAAGQEPFLSIRKVTYGPDDAYRITVLSCTPQCHDAPSLLEEDGTRIGPGISVYDARFAIVVEKSFYRFLCTKRAFDSPWRYPVIPKNAGKIKAKQREEDLKLAKKELTRQAFIQTPSMQDVTPYPVPEPLPCVSNEPCTDDDFAETIGPLFSRGWYIVYNNVTVNVNGEFKLQKQPVLNGFFRFTSFPAAMQFSRDVLDLAGVEKIIVSLWLDAQTVTVQGLSEVGGAMLMRRDVRFAALVEQLFVDQYSRHARRSQVRAMKFLAQPMSVEELVSHPGARSHRTYMWNKWEKILHKRQLVEDRVREAEAEAEAIVTVT